MHKVLCCILILLIISAQLSGCYDARELEDLTYVFAIGIDRGISDKWRLTILFPAMDNKDGNGSGSGGGSGSAESKNESYEVVTIDAPAFFTALNMLNTSIPRELNFMHTKYLVISEELARSGTLGDYLAPIVRYRQVRRIINVAVSKGSAREFIKELSSVTGATLPKAMTTSMGKHELTGFFHDIDLNDFYNGMKSTYRAPVAALGGVNDFSSFKLSGKKWEGGNKTGGEYKAGEIPRLGGSKTEFMGCALFDGDTMVGELNGEETRLMLMGRGEFIRGFFNIPDPIEPSLSVPIDIRHARKPKIDITYKGDKPIINMRIQLEGDILAIQSRINYENEDLTPLLERAFEQHIKDGMDKLIAKCQALNLDVFQFGRTAIWQFGTIEEWESYNWLSHFKDSEITCEVKFSIRRTGGMLKSSPIIKSEEKRQ